MNAAPLAHSKKLAIQIKKKTKGLNGFNLKQRNSKEITFAIVFLVLIVSYSTQYSRAASPIVINNGANFTNSTIVMLNLNASEIMDPVTAETEICVNNDNLTWTSWQNYTSPINWTLSDGDGEKTVYLSFRPNSTSPSTEITSSNITLDTTPPSLNFTNPSSDLVEFNESTVQAEWIVTDSGSGLNHTEISLDNETWIYIGTNNTQTFPNLSNGLHTLVINLTDNVGNSQTTSIRFNVNVPQPTSSPSPTPTSTPSPASTSTPSTTLAPTLSPTPSNTTNNETPIQTWMIYLIAGASTAALATGALFIHRKRKNEKATNTSIDPPDFPPSTTQKEENSKPTTETILKESDMKHIQSQDPSNKNSATEQHQDESKTFDTKPGSKQTLSAIKNLNLRNSEKKNLNATQKKTENPKISKSESKQAIPPSIDKIEPNIIEYTTNAKILIKGQNLKAKTVLIRFGQTDPIILDTDNFSDEEIPLILPKEMEIGINTVQIIHQGKGTAEKSNEQTSNVSLLVLAPKIIDVYPASVPRGNDITISMEPNVAPSQQITVFLGNKKFSTVSGKEYSGKISLKIPNDFPVGNYLVRVRINGADSITHEDFPKININ